MRKMRAQICLRPSWKASEDLQGTWKKTKPNYFWKIWTQTSSLDEF